MSSNQGSVTLPLFRVAVSLIAITTWLSNGLLIKPVSVGGEVLLVLLLLVGCIGLVDVLINDVLPSRFQWDMARRERHYLLAAMAFCYVAQMFVSYKNVTESGLIFYYLLNAFSLMVFAAFDAQERSKGEKWSANCSN